MNNNTMPNSRENNLNIIRFIAAVMVIYGHMFPIMGQYSYTIFNQAVSTIGVEIFFVISGYLITKSFLSDKSPVCYAIKRIFRIIPGLLALCLVSVFVLGPIVSDFTTQQYFGEYFEYAWDYMKNVIMFPIYSLPGVFTDNIYPGAVNGSLWTLPIEAAMYILVPVIIAVFGRKKGYKVGLVAAAIAAVVLNYIKLKWYPSARVVVWGTDLMAAMNLVPYFLVGALFTFDKIKKLLNLQVASLLFFVTIMLFTSYQNTQFLMVIVLPYFIFSLAFDTKPVFMKFGTKIDLSYGMYLYGFVIQQLLVKYIGKYNLSVNVMFVLSTVLSMGCAVISWYVVEKPAQKFGKFLTKKYREIRYKN